MIRQTNFESLYSTQESWPPDEWPLRLRLAMLLASLHSLPSKTPFGKPQDVVDEVKRRIDDLAPDGGFVFAAVHNIQAFVPPENIVADFDTALLYGRSHPSSVADEDHRPDKEET